MAVNREKNIKKAIRIIWESLDSHLDWTHEVSKDPCKYCGGKNFHKKCVQEYAEAIKLLSDVL